jgi:hypothetical protein
MIAGAIFICNDPQKDKNKKHAQSKLKAIRSFMALFDASFTKPEARECAQRMIDAWDEDHIYPSCIKPCFFAHECNPKDINVTQQAHQAIANSQLLHHLEEAHNPHITHLQASNPVTFGTSFFLPTEGHSVSSASDPSPIRQYQDDTESSRSDSRSIREDNSQSDSSSEDGDIEAGKRSDDQGSSHRGSDSSGDLSDQLGNTYGGSPPWSDDDE